MFLSMSVDLTKEKSIPSRSSFVGVSFNSNFLHGTYEIMNTFE